MIFGKLVHHLRLFGPVDQYNQFGVVVDCSSYLILLLNISLPDQGVQGKEKEGCENTQSIIMDANMSIAHAV